MTTQEHSPCEFYYPGETNDPQMLRFKAKVFSTKSEQIAIQQSDIINPLLTSPARSVRESIAFGFAPSSLGLYEKPQTIFSRTDLALS